MFKVYFIILSALLFSFIGFEVRVFATEPTPSDAIRYVQEFSIARLNQFAAFKKNMSKSVAIPINIRFARELDLRYRQDFYNRLLDIIKATPMGSKLALPVGVDFSPYKKLQQGVGLAQRLDNSLEKPELPLLSRDTSFLITRLFLEVYTELDTQNAKYSRIFLESSSGTERITGGEVGSGSGARGSKAVNLNYFTVPSWIYIQGSPVLGSPSPIQFEPFAEASYLKDLARNLLPYLPEWGAHALEELYPKPTTHFSDYWNDYLSRSLQQLIRHLGPHGTYANHFNSYKEQYFRNTFQERFYKIVRQVTRVESENPYFAAVDSLLWINRLYHIFLDTQFSPECLSVEVGSALFKDIEAGNDAKSTPQEDFEVLFSYEKLLHENLSEPHEKVMKRLAMDRFDSQLTEVLFPRDFQYERCFEPSPLRTKALQYYFAWRDYLSFEAPLRFYRAVQELKAASAAAPELSKVPEEKEDKDHYLRWKYDAGFTLGTTPLVFEGDDHAGIFQHTSLETFSGKSQTPPLDDHSGPDDSEISKFKLKSIRQLMHDIRFRGGHVMQSDRMNYKIVFKGHLFFLHLPSSLDPAKEVPVESNFSDFYRELKEAGISL